MRFFVPAETLDDYLIHYIHLFAKPVMLALALASFSHPRTHARASERTMENITPVSVVKRVRMQCASQT
jgi:hypothetical protein